MPQEQAVVAAQREFDDARAALDEAERARDDPLSGGGGAPPDDVVTKLHSQAVTDAATRQGAAASTSRSPRSGGRNAKAQQRRPSRPTSRR